MDHPYQRICLLFAVPQEFAPLRRRLKARRAQVGRYRAFDTEAGGVRVLLLATGMGRRCAARAAEEVLGAWSPDLLVMTGVAGALSPALRVGDLVLADAVVSEAGKLFPTAAGVSGQESLIRRGALHSLDRVLTSAEEKAEAAARFPECLAVEMETAGIAPAAEARGAAWGAVRAISDTAADALPLDFNRLRAPDGNLSPSRLAAEVLSHPNSIPGLIALGRGTALAAERLTDYWMEWLQKRT